MSVWSSMSLSSLRSPNSRVRAFGPSLPEFSTRSWPTRELGVPRHSELRFELDDPFSGVFYHENNPENCPLSQFALVWCCWRSWFLEGEIIFDGEHAFNICKTNNKLISPAYNRYLKIRLLCPNETTASLLLQLDWRSHFNSIDEASDKWILSNQIKIATQKTCLMYQLIPTTITN